MLCYFRHAERFQLLIGPLGPSMVQCFPDRIPFIRIPFPDKEEIMNAFYGCSEYIAPEVFEGKVHDNSGSWAIGISMFVMLTGFFPFDSRTKIKE